MDDNHLLQLQIFLKDMRNQVSQGAYFHYGDLIWRMNFISNNFNESQDIRIWKKDNSIIGFVFDLAKENNPEFFIQPEFYDSIYLEEMIKYSVESAKSRKASYIDTSCLISDKVKEQCLSSNGFKKQDDIMVVMEINLSETVDILSLPSNYKFVEAEECDNYRNSLNWLTNKQLNVIVNESNINSCLSSIICYKSKEIVSGSLCWFDSIGNCGVFEPVETYSKHQKNGLAFIGMKKSLAKLKELGAKKAYVKTGKENNCAILLYEKLGFCIIEEDYGWRLEL